MFPYENLISLQPNNYNIVDYSIPPQTVLNMIIAKKTHFELGALSLDFYRIAEIMGKICMTSGVGYRRS